MKVLLSALLLSLPATLSAAEVQNVFQFDGYLNVNGEFVKSAVTTEPLSSKAASIWSEQGGFTELITIPFTLIFPEAPAGATNIYSLFGLLVSPESYYPQPTYEVTPVVADCGGNPCPFTAAIFAPDAFIPFIEIQSPAEFGPDLHGKAFDAKAVVSIPVPFHAMNPGFNATTVMTLTGPTRYNFSVIARTRWESAVPEPSSIALAGLGLGIVASNLVFRSLRND